MSAYRILYTQTAYPPSVGGAQTYLHQFARRLAGNHDIRVVSFWRDNRTDWLQGTTWRAPGGNAYRLDGVPVDLIDFSPAERRRLFPWSLLYYAWPAKAVERIAATILPYLRRVIERPQLIHHGRVGREPLGFASLALARELGIPFVLTPFHHPRWTGRRYRLYHQLYRRADCVIALTNAERDTLMSLGVDRAKIKVLGVGPDLSSEQVDPEAFRRQYHLASPIVLFLGQKYPYKGYDLLLQAAPLVWRDLPQATFLFIGPRTRASRRRFKNNHDPRIIEWGSLSPQLKTAVLAVCDLLCVPSTQESFGIVFLEAWQMGKAVIGGDNPAVRCVIADGVDGFISPPDPRALAGRIIQLLNDSQLRERMALHGQQKIMRYYNWQYLTTKMDGIYRRLISSGAA